MKADSKCDAPGLQLAATSPSTSQSQRNASLNINQTKATFVLPGLSKQLEISNVDTCTPRVGAPTNPNHRLVLHITATARINKINPNDTTASGKERGTPPCCYLEIIGVRTLTEGKLHNKHTAQTWGHVVAHLQQKGVGRVRRVRHLERRVKRREQSALGRAAAVVLLSFRADPLSEQRKPSVPSRRGTKPSEAMRAGSCNRTTVYVLYGTPLLRCRPSDLPHGPQAVVCMHEQQIQSSRFQLNGRL